MAAGRDRGLNPAGESGFAAGRPYELWLPPTEPPWPAMIVIHGAGSRKENHSDFARVAAAAGWVAISYDQRGHGADRDSFSPSVVGDVITIAAFLGERDGIDRTRICVRGSSMGGLVAIEAAARSGLIAAVIAVCPADPKSLLAGLERDAFDFRLDPELRGAVELWLQNCDSLAAARALAPRALIVMHAEGDEQVPSTGSRRLIAAAGEPKRLILVPGGHHRSLQHDPEMQAAGLRWIACQLAERA